MRKERPINTLEHDWCSAWRHLLCYMHNTPHLGKWIKRKMNKRARRKGRQECQESLNDQ